MSDELANHEGAGKLPTLYVSLLKVGHTVFCLTKIKYDDVMSFLCVRKFQN